MTLTILRPSTVGSTYGSVVVTGTGGAAGVTANSPADDTSYISSAYYGNGLDLDMQDITLTASQRAKALRVRLRIFHNSADVGWDEKVDVRLRGTVTGKTTSAWTAHTVSNSALEQTSGWWTTDPLGQLWTDLGVDRTQVFLAWRARDTGGVTQLRVSEVYLEVDVHAQLVVTTVTAAGFSSSTRPTFTWTLQADPDNDPQVRYRVKVFSSTQYGASNFNPDTSASTWDSGELSGNVQAGTVGKDLINGVTYKVYVKSAKAWVPTGSLWWSDWTASSAFTVNTVPPIVPSLTVSTLPDLPWYRVLVKGTAPVNLLTSDEASFDFSSVGGWANDTNTATPTAAATAPVPKSGTGRMGMTASTAATMAVAAPVKIARPGITYTGGASFRANATARSVQVLIRFKRGATTLSTITGTAVADTTTGYTAVTASGTAPAGTDGVQLVAQVVTPAAAEVHGVDEAFLHVGTTTAYTPGGLGTTQTVPLERGERVDTSRGPASNWAHPQVWSGGTEQRNPANGFNPLSSADSLAWEPLDVSMDGPAGMIHWSVRSGASNPLRVGDSADPLLAADYLFPVVPNAAHTFSVWVWSDTALSSRLNIDWVDATGATISTVNGSGITLSATPTQYTFTSTAISTAIFARGTVSNLGASSTANVFLTRVGWGLGSTAVDDQPPRGGALVWNPVRDLTEFGDPVQPGEQLQLADAELAPGRPVVYRARTLATYVTDTIASDYSGYVPAYMAPPARALLKDPFQPERAQIANVWAGDQTAKDADAVTLKGMGRNGDPVKLTSWLGRARSIEFSALSHADYDRLTKVLDSPRSLYLQWPEGGAEYVLVDGWQSTRTVPGFYKTISVSASNTQAPV